MKYSSTKKKLPFSWVEPDGNANTTASQSVKPVSGSRYIDGRLAQITNTRFSLNRVRVIGEM